MTPELIPYLVLSPFALALATVWLVGRQEAIARVLAVWPALLALLFGRELAAVVAHGPRMVELAWAPSLGLTLSFRLDALGLLFALLITGVGALVVLYASRYLAGHPHAARFHGSLHAFMGAMLGVVLSDNVFALFVFWELTGVTSFLLIGFDHERAESRSAAMQALIVTGGGGLALLAAGILLVDLTGTTSLATMTAHAADIVGHASYPVVVALVLLAAFTKSAQFPFHFWLPGAMAAPTPVSAYLHSATMVKAGVYLVARMMPVVGGTATWQVPVMIAGGLTMLLGAGRAVQETDLKRILAYSTISALGVLMLLLGVGTPASVMAAVVYLLAHACYKGALFLVAGTIDHETGTRDVTRLGGLRRVLPVTSVAAALAALSMAGVPLTVGFIGKDAAYEALLGAGRWSLWITGATVAASALMGLAGLLAGVSPFWGRVPADGATTHAASAAHEEPSSATSEAHAHGHETWDLWLPPVVLAAAGLAAGLVPMWLNGVVGAARAPGTVGAAPVSLAIWHGLTPALLLSVGTFVLLGLAWMGRSALRTRTWTPPFGTEQLYTGALRALDATGQAIAPALHSASLRSYVMVTLLTTVVLGLGMLVYAGGPYAVAPDTAVRVHDVLIVVVIVSGAIGAVRARSTMAAVLALGTVGYGVAVTFLLFGAPDLAMTQFSVETLTVLIYVLVFRHFRNLGALSQGWIRARDAAIAGAVGLFIGLVALMVATTTTAPALREFFVTNGPTIGHGRNIVNVILVDFRAFDTLGEITVLATAAIGVHALLRMAGERTSRAGSPETVPIMPAGGDEDDAQVAATASAIFQTATRRLLPLLLLFAVFLLLRGHNQPGGGFVGGLVAAAAYALYAMAYGVARARRALLVEPRVLIGTGLLVALASGVAAVLAGRPFLSALWVLDPVAVGTPVVFDIGVCLVVTGVVSMMMSSLAEDA